MSEEVIGAVAPEPVAPQVEGAQAETAAPEEKKPERTFTQAELDDILEKRLGKERRKRAEIETRLKVTEELALRGKPQEPNAEPRPADGEPKREAFDTYEGYLEALAEWKAERKASEAIEKRFREQDERAQNARQQATQHQQQEKWQSSVTKAAQRYEDFDEVLEASQAPLTRKMHEALMESEMAADVAYYLAKHGDEAERIAQLPVSQQAREIWKLEQKIPGSTKQPSKAPPPIDTVKGRTTVADDGEPDPKDTEKWVAWRNKQIAKARRG